MTDALRLAAETGEAGEVPVAAIITDSAGEVIAMAGNRVERDHDPSAHAEILAIRQAAAIMGSARLNDCDLWVTLEPCAMCAAAISHARIRRLYYGADDPKSGGVAHGARVFSHATCHHKPEVYSGIGAEQSAALLKDFFARRR
ncbi:MAG: tRNA-specific adenosine deaminase [SAR116 cluster bacterium MED-G04]|nr:MAG: tRNA-specific adenosine deaminase [SAR116 cluster bacterium MED-G04]HCD49517.1 tRNA-specific adenosine deaminase [Alphaproteobacteria bacterium]